MTGRARAWALGGVAVLAALALASAVVLVGDGDDASPPPAATGGPTTVPLPAVTDDPQSYAELLFAAWQNDDRGAAAEVASAAAVTEMFARPYRAAEAWTPGGCGLAAGSLYCTWTASTGTTLTMTVRTLTGGLPIEVVDVERQAS